MNDTEVIIELLQGIDARLHKVEEDVRLLKGDKVASVTKLQPPTDPWKKLYFTSSASSNGSGYRIRFQKNSKTAGVCDPFLKGQTERSKGSGTLTEEDAAELADWFNEFVYYIVLQNRS